MDYLGKDNEDLFKSRDRENLIKNFGRNVSSKAEIRKIKEEHKNTFDAKKGIALVMASVLIATEIYVVSDMHKDWKNNTNYCNLTNQEETSFGEYVTEGPRTKTVYVELEDEKYMFGNREEGLELYNAAVLNEYETSGVDKKDDFIKENYENYLVYVGEQLQAGEKITGEDYIDYVLEENSKGAR